MCKLLTRTAFREGVFERDGRRCVICQKQAKDVHHIMERRLFHDGGYYLNNGASLCGDCHINAEMTTLSVEEIREACGISAGKKVIPEHLYGDQRYDKWGNPILGNGMRVQGELFHDTSVQKILQQGGMLEVFNKYVKYPRTYHLMCSESVGKDDRTLKSYDIFEGQQVVVTLKMDGENTTMYRDNIHARSLDSKYHESRWWVNKLQSEIGHDIPEGWRICGENLYAKHTIQYQFLTSYFLVFSIWNDNNECLDWDDTLGWCDLLGLRHVPVLYEGIWNEKSILDNFPRNYEGDPCEGFVVRLRGSFQYGNFRSSVAKYVAKKFRQDMEGTLDNFKPWYLRSVIRNQLRKDVLQK